MKNSLSSTGPRRLGLKYVVLAVLLLLITSATSCFAGETSQELSKLPRKLHTHRHFHRPCDSFSHEKPRSLCNQIHRNRRHSHYLPPPSQLGEIDPRYGVEKRLVPSGPNPLHN
ncbi:hypothetical protein L484_004255 [Morus notabilis]|uniref:CLAVATA3/ESR (CLE)-related protein 9 n=1 Tax=Morus notabilis TaxID=981085 RepID=W9RAB5_9ROSA|nr:hypothetical protein L484_004255 [Morus notabilis]